MSDVSKLPAKFSDSFSDEEFHEHIATKSNSWGVKTIFAALLLYHVMCAETTSVKDKAKIAIVLGNLVMAPAIMPMPLFVGLTREMLKYLGIGSTSMPEIVKDNLSPAIIADAKSSLRLIKAYSQVSDEEASQILEKWGLKELDIDF